MKKNINTVCFKNLTFSLVFLGFLFISPVQAKESENTGSQSESIVQMYRNDVELTDQQMSKSRIISEDYIALKDSINKQWLLTAKERMDIKRTAFARMDSMIVELLNATQKKSLNEKRKVRQKMLSKTNQ